MLQVAQESMRLQPVAHAGLRRVATRDVAFSNGLVVPKGTTVMGSQLSLMSDPAWGWTDPDAFRPVRTRHSLGLANDLDMDGFCWFALVVCSRNPEVEMLPTGDPACSWRGSGAFRSVHTQKALRLMEIDLDAAEVAVCASGCC